MAADPRLGGLDGGADLFGLGLFIVQLRAPKAVQGPDLGGGQLPAGAGAVRPLEGDRAGTSFSPEGAWMVKVPSCSFPHARR